MSLVEYFNASWTQGQQGGIWAFRPYFDDDYRLKNENKISWWNDTIDAVEQKGRKE